MDFSNHPDSDSEGADYPMKRQRLRNSGIAIGSLPAGHWNAITDVAGIRVGHQTLIRGESIRTGVTAILPHSGNVYQEKVPAAAVCFNGYGKLTGSTQINELGTLETPIILTNTLSIGTAVSAVIRYILLQDGNELVSSVNAVVGETNDGFLNDIRGMHVTESDVLAAIESAKEGSVAEGNVGAGTGITAFGYKSGIGTSSRLAEMAGGTVYHVGALVQPNFGTEMMLRGSAFRGKKRRLVSEELCVSGGGSCVIVVATDAPLDARNLKRVALRSFAGMARTCSVMANRSGDYAIAFTTAWRVPNVPLSHDDTLPPLVSNDAMDTIFQAVEESVQEAIYNGLYMAEAMSGHRGSSVDAIDPEKIRRVLNGF